MVKRLMISRLYNLAFFLVSILVLSCEESTTQSYCNVNNPVEELSWLDSLVQKLETNEIGYQIILYSYHDETVFYVNDCFGCADGLINVYDCTGNIICQFGGIAGIDTCPDFYDLALDSTMLIDKAYPKIILDAEAYKTAPDDPLTINSVSISGNLLTINFTSGGCDGSSWEVKLIDSEQVMESYPIQKALRLSLKNEEVCYALVTKEITFNIKASQVKNYHKILLNIKGHEEQVLYEY